MDAFSQPIKTPAHIESGEPVSEEQAQTQIQKLEKASVKFRRQPKDEFGHKTNMIDIERPENPHDVFDIITKELAIASIKDDELLRCYQIEFNVIIDAYDIGMWDHLGSWMSGRLISELQLSKSKGGLERRLQAGTMPSVGNDGFGDFFRKREDEEAAMANRKDNRPLLQKLINKDGGGQYA